MNNKLVLYIMVCLMVLVMSWEYNKGSAASLVTEGEIPEEAIRLRVLAHSDSALDQALKRTVRDEVVAQMALWAEELESIEEARAKLETSLPEIEQIVERVLRERGFTYSYKVEYGQISFPAKLYGSKFYQAGEYEGLRITIGSGQGDNWWCVLFPPLCFVDFATGEVIDPDQEAKDQYSSQQVEVKFFLAELFKGKK